MKVIPSEILNLFKKLKKKKEVLPECSITQEYAEITDWQGLAEFLWEKEELFNNNDTFNWEED